MLEIDNNIISWLPCFTNKFELKKHIFFNDEKKENYEVDGVALGDLKQELLIQSHILEKKCDK